MTIAYLVIAHDYPQLFKRLVDALLSPQSIVVVHIDAKVDLAQFKKVVPECGRVKYVAERVEVHWGGWSQVQATLNTIEAALRFGAPERFVLLSAACLPLRKAEDIESFFEGNSNEYLSCRPFPDMAMHKPRSRLSKWHLEAGDRTPGFIARLRQVFNKLAKLMPSRDVKNHLGEYQAYTGSNWWALTRDAIEQIRSSIIEHPEIIALYRYSKCPDESFFQTLVANSPLKDRIVSNVTYADWSNPLEQPAFINMSHLEALRHADDVFEDGYGTRVALFARKFGPRNIHVGDIALATSRMSSNAQASLRGQL